MEIRELELNNFGRFTEKRVNLQEEFSYYMERTKPGSRPFTRSSEVCCLEWNGGGEELL